MNVCFGLELLNVISQSFTSCVNLDKFLNYIIVSKLLNLLETVSFCVIKRTSQNCWKCKQVNGLEKCRLPLSPCPFLPWSPISSFPGLIRSRARTTVVVKCCWDCPLLRKVAGCYREKRWAFGAGLALGRPWEVKMGLMPMIETTFRTGQSSKNSKMFWLTLRKNKVLSWDTTPSLP